MLAMSICSSAQNVDDVFQSFVSIPDSTRTKVWWFHGENITTREGITADLEAFRRVGVGGVVYYDQQYGPGVPESLKSMSREWWEMLKFAAQEAKRLGLSFEINISNGYVCGGPWITPELGMQAVYSAETWVKGGEHYKDKLASPDRRDERDIAVLAFPVKEEYHRTVKCLPEGFATDKPATVMLAQFDEPFTARSLSYWSNGDSKGAQSIINVPCDPQEDFCGDSFTRLPDLGELEVSMDGKRWTTVCPLRPCYRMQSLRPNATISFPAVTGRYFRLNLHDWTAEGKEHKELTLKEVELSARAVTDRWEERAAYASEYIGKTKTPDYEGDEVIARSALLDISSFLDAEGRLDWQAPQGTDWLVVRFVYAPTMASTKHGRPNLMGLECDKLLVQAAKLHWNNYAQAILDSLQTIGCRPSGVCMDSHEAGQQNWTHDFPQLFRQRNGYDIIPFLPAMQGYIVGSVAETEQFLSDLRRTIADGISNRYLATLQQMAAKAGVHFTAQATGNGQSICSDNLMAKGQVERPQGEFWTRNHDGSYDIKEASSAAHLYGRRIASAEAFTAFSYAQTFGEMKDEIDMAAAFHVNELVVCASEAQPWLDRYPGNVNNRIEYALNRNNTMWPFSRPFWDYQARNSFIQRLGQPVVDILVYAGDETPMKILAHRLPVIPEGYDFDVCTTDALHQQLSYDNRRLVTRNGMSYRMLAIEKSAVVRPETERVIARWKSQGLPVYDNRNMGDDEMDSVLKASGIRPDIELKSRKGATNRVFFTHRQTDDADFYFICNHSKTDSFADDITLRTDYAQAEWWDADRGVRRRIPAVKTDKGLKMKLELRPNEAGFIVARKGAAADIPLYRTQRKERVEPIAGQWTVKFDTQLGGPENPVVFNRLTDWTLSPNPDIRYFSGMATYEKTISVAEPRQGERLLLRLPELKGVARVLVNDCEAGYVWTSPWEADITDWVRKGKNSISIEVRNSLVNRIIGDAALPESKRRTWSTVPIYTTGDCLVPSGISGNVLLVVQE